MQSVQDPRDWISSQKSFKMVLLIGCLVLAIGLLGLILNGWYSRYMQDDYCFDFLLKQHGFWSAQISTFFNEITFNGNRYSANFLMGLMAAVGKISAQILPGLMVIGWLAAGYFLMRQIDHFLALKWIKPVLFFIAEAVVFFTLVLAPNLHQILYWRPGAVTYMMPLIFITLLFGLGLHFINQNQKTTGKLFLVGFIALLAGGFSETAAVFFLGLLSLLYLFFILRKPVERRVYKNLILYLSAALVGVVLSILILIIAPSAQLRQAALFPHPPDYFTIIRISIGAAWQFIVLTLYRYPTPTWLILVLFFFIGMGTNPQLSPKIIYPKQNPWITIMMFALSTLLLMVCVAAPSAYASSSPPEERAMLLSRFILVVSSLSIAMILGRWVSRNVYKHNSAKFVLIFCIFLISCSIAVVLIIPAQKTFEPIFPEIRNWLKENPWRILFPVSAILMTFFLIIRELKILPVLGKIVSLMLLIVIILSSLGGLVSVYSALPKFQLRAQLWDWRDAQILSAIQKGRYEIVLPALDSIAGVMELQAEAGHWVNNCAELFYGMKSIRVVEPVMTHLPGS
jgi:hypothetical protein